MAADVLDAVFEVPQPLRQIALEEPLAQDAAQFLRKVEGISDATGDDLLVDFQRLFGEEGRETGGHFVDEDSQSPPVHGLIVAPRKKHLGRQVLGGAAQGVGATGEPFGEPEIRDLDVAVESEEDVFGLQIAEGNVNVVKILSFRS